MDRLREQKYIPAFHKPEMIEDNAWLLVLYDKKIVMKKEENNFVIPRVIELDGITSEDETLVYIGSYDGHDCYCKRVNELITLQMNMEFMEMREITNASGDAGLFLLAGTANHILHWNSMNQFCGRCGHKTTDKEDERAKLCSSCGNIIYPRISPATITAVFRGDQILLAHNHNFRKDLYSLIAGYVEPGEALEQCVEREIKEEVGIKVKNIRYFGSQPWSFPDSLMIAFTAEYESGEIKVDDIEITDAAWFTADSLPEIPSNDSIAGRIIRWYKDMDVQ